jgi:hypothetical protein
MSRVLQSMAYVKGKECGRKQGNDERFVYTNIITSPYLVVDFLFHYQSDEGSGFGS